MDNKSILHENEEPIGSISVTKGLTPNGVSRLLTVTANRILRSDGDSYVSIPHSSVEYVEFRRHPSERPYEDESILMGIIGFLIGGMGLGFLSQSPGIVSACTFFAGVSLIAGAGYLYTIKNEYYENMTVTTSQRTFQVASGEKIA